MKAICRPRVTGRPEMMTGAQIRKARAILKWSQADLARAAGLSPESVMQAEGIGPRLVPLATTAAITHAIEQAGIEYGRTIGVRLKRDDGPERLT